MVAGVSHAILPILRKRDDGTRPGREPVPKHRSRFVHPSLGVSFIEINGLSDDDVYDPPSLGRGVVRRHAAATLPRIIDDAALICIMTTVV